MGQYFAVMDISVSFGVGPSGNVALVRFKGVGQRPEFRSLPLAGPPEESVNEIEAFILAHLEGPAQWQGWLWEA
jgi:hypothetical protein